MWRRGRSPPAAALADETITDNCCDNNANTVRARNELASDGRTIQIWNVQV